MQPVIKDIKTRTDAIRAFHGLSLRETVSDGFLAEAENLSASGYPALTTRAPRGVITECAGVTAMFSHDEMCWLEGENLYYGTTLAGRLAPGAKQFASMGTRVVIYPDKQILDTRSRTLSPIENSVSVMGAEASITDAEGQPANESNYVKIEAAGIGAGFRKGDGVTIAGFAEPKLNGSFILRAVEDDYIIVLAALARGESASDAITVTRSAPDLDYICAFGNRVWGCSSNKHAIYACALGDACNWNAFEGISTDSYAAVVASPGAFTGCAAFLGSAVFFKEGEIIKLFGSKPSNFQLLSSAMPGVSSPGSLAYTNSALYYKGLSGVYAYDGSAPVCISQALGDARYTNALAGAVNGRYYISMYDRASAVYRLYVYDTLTGAWYGESAPQLRFFASAGDDLFFAGANGIAYNANGARLWYDPQGFPSARTVRAESNMPWRAQTGPIALKTPNNMYVTRLHVYFSLAAHSSLTASIKYESDGAWNELASFSGAEAQREVVAALPVRAHRAMSAYLRLSGTGKCAITAITKTYETGGLA